MIHFGELKKSKFIKIFFLILFIIYILIININNGHKISKKFYNNIKNLDYSTSFIAHAGGGIDGEAYTNSLEAVNNSIKKDFNWQPSTSIDQGLEYLLRWYENNFVGKDFSHLKIN